MFFFLFGFISTWKAEIPDDLVSIDQFLKKLTFKGSSSPIKCGQSTVISSLTRLTKTSTIKLTTSFSGEIRWVKSVNLMATKNWVLKRILREGSAPVEIQPLTVYILSLDRKGNHFVLLPLKKKLMNEEGSKKVFLFGRNLGSVKAIPGSSFPHPPGLFFSAISAEIECLHLAGKRFHRLPKNVMDCAISVTKILA